MYLSLLLLLMWPLVLAAVVTGSLRDRLRRPARFFLLGLLACVGLEITLSGGYLFVVAGWDISGMLFKLLLGGAVFYLLFRMDQRAAA